MRESRMLDARLETLDTAARRAYLEQRLRETSRRAWGREVGFDDLPALPITRKDALGSMQAANPPSRAFWPGRNIGCSESSSCPTPQTIRNALRSITSPSAWPFP